MAEAEVLEEEEKAGYEEGCLSVPSFYEEVIRPVNVEISFNDLDGRKNKIKPAGQPKLDLKTFGEDKLHHSIINIF